MAAWLVACSSGGGDTSPQISHGETAPSATSVVTSPGGVPGPAPSGIVDLADGARRYGDGRGLFAAADATGDRTTIATTIGVVTVAGNGSATTISPGRAVRFTATDDGQRVAAITSDQQLTIWDVVSGNALATFAVPMADDTAIQFAGADDVLVSDRATVTRYSVDGSTEVLLTAPADGAVGPLAVDARGTVAIPVQSATPSLQTWSRAAGEGAIDLGLAPGSRLTGVVWSPDSTHLAVLDAPPSAGDQLRVFDVATGGFVGTAVPLANYVTPNLLAFPTDDRIVLPLVERVVAYDLQGTEVGSSPIGPSQISGLRSSGGAAIVAHLDGAVERWTVAAAPTPMGERTVTLVDLRSGAAGLSTVDQRGLVRTYGPDGTERHRFDHWAVGEATSVDEAADGATIAVSTSTGAVRLMDVATGTETEVLDRAQGDVSDVALAPDDTIVATGVSVQKRAEAWDDTIEATTLASKATMFTLGGQSEDVAGCSFYEGHVTFSPDGQLLASSSHDFTVQVTPLADPGATKVLPPHLGTVYDIRFSPDGTRLFTTSDDGSLRVWQVDGWELLGDFRALTGGYVSLAFSPQGTLAVSGTTGEIAIVDPATGTATMTFAGARAVLGEMTFTPDGQRILAPLPNGAVGIWSVASGQQVGELSGHTMPVTAIAVVPDGTRVYTSSQDGTVRSWPLPPA
jgi:WD40 repeat protein